MKRQEQFKNRLEVITQKSGREFRSKAGTRWQHFGLDALGKLVFAGVNGAHRCDAKAARKVFRRWREWRHIYDRTTRRGESYPSKDVGRVIFIALESPDGRKNVFRV